MIHAYREQYAEIIQHKTAEMFELAVLNEKLSIDAFAESFASSVVAAAFESMDPIYILGRSSNELIASIMNKPPVDIYTAAYASPEYWDILKPLSRNHLRLLSKYSLVVNY